MAQLVPVSEAKPRLFQLVKDSDEEDVMLTRRGHPTAVILSARRYDALLEEMQDLRDRLSVAQQSVTA